MAKQCVTFSLDVEASGPIPGPWWMCSFGVCRTDDVAVGIYRELKPMVIEGLSEPDSPAAMRVVAQGIPGFSWGGGGSEAENVRRVRAHYEQHGIEPQRALLDLKHWLAREAGTGNRAVLIGSPITYDFMWLYWYWWHFLEEMPDFGYSGLDLRSYFMGSHGVGFLGTGKERYLKHYPNDFPKTHHPLDDARQQGKIWQDMVAAREEGRRGRP